VTSKDTLADTFERLAYDVLQLLPILPLLGFDDHVANLDR
jgi:hypothetical protein